MALSSYLPDRNYSLFIIHFSLIKKGVRHISLQLKRLILTAVAACMLFCGCNLTGIGEENDLLRPPRTTGDEAEIENLISKTAPKGYTLKYPKSGTHRSAIVMEDLDGDDIEEAIAFFRDKDSVTGVHMLVMYKSEKEWRTSADFETETADVDCVEFSDVDGNGSQEIMVGYTTFTPNVNFLSCYKYSAGATETIDTGSPNYSAFYCGSLDSSGKSKIITLTLFSPEHEAKATMLEYDDSKRTIFAKSSVGMDPNTVSYKNVLFSDLNDKIKGVVVDGANATGEINTQVIYFNKQLNVLRNPLAYVKPENPTKRNSSVISADTDSDMFVEIPTVQPLPNVKDNNTDTPADLVTWNAFNSNAEKLNPKKNVAANYAYNYSIRIPEEWRAGSYTALNSEDKKTMTFYSVEKNKLKDKLFEVRVFDINDWDQAKSGEDYILIYRDVRYAYTFINYETDGSFSQDNDQIKTAFAVLSEIAV